MTNTNTTSKTSSKFAFTFDHVSKTIVGTDVNFQKAGIPGSKQEKELMARIEAHPNYSFKVIETEKKPAKKTYAGLTCDLMKEYISIQAEDKKADLMAQFENMVEEKKAYPTIKSWFLDEFKNFSVSKAKSQIKNHKLVSAKTKVRLIKAAPKAVPAKEPAKVVNF